MIALDTNILVYAVQRADHLDRHLKSITLFEKLEATGAIIPLQVIGEFLNVCRAKAVTPLASAAQAVDLWFRHFECPHTLGRDYLVASGLSERYDLQFFDAMIIHVSSRAGATMLLSEDMHDGLEIDGLRIVNPFVAGNEALLASYFGSVP